MVRWCIKTREGLTASVPIVQAAGFQIFELSEKFSVQSFCFSFPAQCTKQEFSVVSEKFDQHENFDVENRAIHESTIQVLILAFVVIFRRLSN